MTERWIQDQIESWVGDYLQDTLQVAVDPSFGGQADVVLVDFLQRACAVRGVGPADIERSDLKDALLGGAHAIALSTEARPHVPLLIRDFLTDLEIRGRLADGEQLGLQVAALRQAYLQAATPAPIERPASKLGRNDPCPCGSGRKYKKCCMKALD